MGEKGVIQEKAFVQLLLEHKLIYPLERRCQGNYIAFVCFSSPFSLAFTGTGLGVYPSPLLKPHKYFDFKHSRFGRLLLGCGG